jgi:hypothetical protein
MLALRVLCLTTAALLASSCGNDEEFVDSDSDTCRAHGALTDLNAEPRYSADYLHRWATGDGCAVRLDVLMTRQGEDSCGGEQVADILMGTPLGRSQDKSRPRSFIRDPKGILVGRKTSEAFDAHAQLPVDAKDTGYRQDDLQLWMRPADDSFVYLVGESDVEAWPRMPTPGVGCA